MTPSGPATAADDGDGVTTRSPRRASGLPPVKKLLFAVHGWLGLSLGLPLFVVCLSGTFAVVSHEIDWLLNPAVRAPTYAGPVNWGAIERAVRDEFPEDHITLLSAPVGRGFAAQAWVQAPWGQHRVFADPATGVVTGDASWFNAQRFFRDFHRRFFWGSAWGITLVSSFAVVLLSSTLTGLLFYKRWWAKLFTLRFHKGRRVLWSDLHRLTGVWTLLFAGVISVTGLFYLFEGPIARWAQPGRAAESKSADVGSGSKGADAASKSTAAASLAKGEIAGLSNEEIIAAEAKRAGEEAGDGAGASRKNSRLATLGPIARPLSASEYAAIADEAFPGLEIRSIWLPTRPGEPVRVEGQAEAWFVRDRANEVRIDPYSGEVLAVQRAGELAPAVRLIDTVDPLHFGDFGGLASKLVWFGFGLVLSGLMPTGLYLWLRRAEQTASGVAKRMRNEPAEAVPAEIRRATRRRTGLGLAATTAILGWAAVTTCLALDKERRVFAEPVARTAAASIGPWRASAFREGAAEAGGTAVFGLRFDPAAGHANFRRASLAVAEAEPTGDAWRVAGGGLVQREAKVALPESLNGRERLWVALERHDGERHLASYRLGAFAEAPSPGRATPTSVEAMGGIGPLAFYGGFVLFVIAASAVWYRLVWFRRHRPAAAPARIRPVASAAAANARP